MMVIRQSLQALLLALAALLSGAGAYDVFNIDTTFNDGTAVLAGATPNVFTQGRTSAGEPGFLAAAQAFLGRGSAAARAGATVPASPQAWAAANASVAAAARNRLGSMVDPLNPSFDAGMWDYSVLSGGGEAQVARRPRNRKLPRGPNTFWPPRDPLLAPCPAAANVRNFGATGNGGTDDSGAIAAANNQLGHLYFPPGAYYIANSITISKVAIYGKGAWLNIAAGVTVTFTAQIQAGQQDPIFGGAGGVSLQGTLRKITPTWFSGFDDVDRLQRATDSCTGACILLLTRPLYFARAWNARPQVGTFSTQFIFAADGGTGQGVNLQPGIYGLPLTFGLMRGFNDYAIKVLGGARNAEIQILTLDSSNDGIVFSPQLGSRPLIQNVHITHMAMSAFVQNTVVIEGTSQAQLLRGVLVSAGFVQLCGARPGWLNAQSAGLLVRGPIPPSLAKSLFVYQAWDPYQDIYKSQNILLQNISPNPIYGLKFMVEGWGGGTARDGNNGKFVQGTFVNLRANFHLAHGAWVPRQSFGSLTGAGNSIFLGQLDGRGWEYTASPVNTPGDMTVIQGTAAYFTVRIDSNWAPGEVRTFFLDSLYAGNIGARMRCLAKPAWPFLNQGVFCTGFVNLASPATPWRIAVRVRNGAAGVIGGGWDLRLGIQFGL